MADLHPQIESTSEPPPPSPPPPVIVVVVPLPLHSHLNQAIQLATLIASYKIPVHYATSATHCRQAKLRFNGQKSSDMVVHFQELPDPDPISSNPETLHPSLDASLELRHPMAALFRKLSSLSKRVVVIHDSNMAYVVQDIPTIPNVESYCFTCISAFSLCCILTQDILTGEKGSRKLLDQLLVGIEKLPQMKQTVTPEILKFLAAQSPYVNLKHGDIINTWRPLESSYLDLLKNENRDNKPQWAFTPSNFLVDKSMSVENRDKCLVWLDKQPRKSVLFVSFGSSTSMADEQVKELAIGLKQSKQRFLWVLRNAEKADIFGEDKALKTGLPDGFEESVKEIGMVTRDWAPQVEILAHSSVGAFMSHCGWNSCMESLIMGVPIVAWPMHSEQPYNAILVTEVLKAGVMVKECSEDLVGSISIKEAIEEMMESEEGEVKGKRAEELGCVLREAVEEGGATKMEVDDFIAYITREGECLCFDHHSKTTY